MFWCVLGLLVLPTVGALRWLLAPVGVAVVMYWVPLPLVLRVLWVTFGLGGVGGVAGVGVAVIGVGCGLGRGWSLGVTGRGPSPLLAEGFVCGAARWSTRLS